MMKPSRLAWILSLSLFITPDLVRAELFQWTDDRGVIHFTDNMQSVPEAVRNSPHLITRHDFETRTTFSSMANPQQTEMTEPVLQPKPPESINPPQPEPATTAQPIVYYNNPQHVTIVVVNPIVRKPSKKRFCAVPERCPPAFRPNFNDRRYIHPSVFDGGSRQHIHPDSFLPKRK